MQTWIIRTKNDWDFYFNVNDRKDITDLCNSKKNRFLVLDRYKKAINIDDITKIEIAVVTNTLQMNIDSHTKRNDRLITQWSLQAPVDDWMQTHEEMMRKRLA